MKMIMFKYKHNRNQKINNKDSCKRKAEENITERPLKIIRTELLNSNITNILNHYVTSVRKVMYGKRRKQQSWEHFYVNNYSNDFF